MTTREEVLAAIAPGETLHYQELLDRITNPRGMMMVLPSPGRLHGELVTWYAHRTYVEREWLETDFCIARRPAPGVPDGSPETE